jgi:hypothetical protein
MKIRPVEKRFFFHANAVALAAHMRRPEDFFVLAVASSCLPVTGGEGKAETKGESFRDIISYRSASTRVFGDFTDKARAVDFTHGNHGENDLATETHAECQITGLKINNGDRVLEIESLESTMSSHSDRRGAITFRTMSAGFQQIRVDGVGLRLATHTELFTQHPTKQKLVQGFAGNPDMRAKYGSCFFGRKSPGSPSRRIPELDGMIYATVVTGMEWDGQAPAGTAISGHSVKVNGMGTLYFGEIIIEEGFRRFTMLRFQLGSDAGGCGSANEIQTNGTTWPPQ